MFTPKTLAATATAVILGGTALAQSVPMVGGAPMYPNMNIVENAVNSADHTTLITAVQTADLVDTLAGDGPFTVFAPTNDAFAALPAGSVEALLEPGNRDRLTEILTCHVVAAEAFSSAIAGMIADDGGAHPIDTVGGCTFTARMQGGQIMIEDEQGRMATVTQADVDQSNGVIHVIDTVLLPDA
ncbi:fasciclin domain-containing protein [Roseibacterium beibuensis]|uniref:Fasciclin domain-containing protein n=1 Tax=[Roseibacterium] beibuensis TaxID=1193142 RepID=A0ABP9L090_9RHOB|nr:fasciclin domain-containing protein [Roseibacterium beibuensis]MCS6621854.1 fasciclin domain-containing protein [Roseibacterium beibuensis]